MKESISDDFSEEFDENKSDSCLFSVCGCGCGCGCGCFGFYVGGFYVGGCCGGVGFCGKC